MRILIADDQRDVAIPLRDLLEDKGHDAVMVHSAEDAIAQVKENPFDFVLMDQYFPPPGIDGIDAVRQIRKVRSEQKVIILTDFGSMESSHRALDAGAYRYIFRPCDQETILAVMESAHAVTELEDALTGDSTLKKMLDQVGIGVSVIDRSYRILYMNGHQRSISRPDATCGGICWMEFNQNVEATSPCSWCPTHPAMVHGATELRTTASDVKGQLHYYRVVASPVRSTTGEVIASVEFVRDITEQYVAEQKSLSSVDTEKRLEAILARICSLGYERARLYELSEDRKLLRGRFEYAGELVSIEKRELLVEKDGFSKNTISLQNPVIYTKGISESEFGPIQYDEEIGRKDGDRWIEVRLLADGQCVGKIAIDNKKTRPSPPGHPEDPGGISEAHFPYLRMLAEGAAREILRERKLRKLEDQSKRLDTLRMLAEAVASPTPLHEDLKKIVETCAKLIGVQGVHLRLLEDNSLMLRAGQGPYYGIAQGTRKMLTPLEQSSGSVRAWLSGVGVIQDDAQDDQNLLNLIAETQVESQRATLKSIRSWACFPIHFEGNFLGVLGLQSGDLAFFGPTVQDAVKDFIAMIGPIVKIDSWPAELENAQKQLRLAARAAVHQVSNPNYANQLEAQTWLKQYSEGTATIKGAAGVLKSVSANSSRIAKLAERLRRFLKGPEIKRFPEAVRLAGVIARTVGSFLPASDGYRVVVSAESGAPDVHIDPAILADVFGELAANSRKAMKKGGDFTVTIRAATREEALAETLAENGLWARVEVSDSGPGIPPEKKRLVFEPFHSDFAEGSGLGLSLLRETLQGMGGAVREVGEPPCGAKFILLIPVHPREQKERK